MAKLNPFFEVDGKKYEIIRTRAVECEYEKIRERNKLDDNQFSLTNDYAKLMLEYEEIMQKYADSRDRYMTDEGILDENLEKVYNAYKKLADAKYDEIKKFEIENKDFSLSKIQDLAYSNGVELLVFALNEQCNITKEEAKSVWEKFVAHFGRDVSQQWIDAMIQTLFEKDEEEENPFLKQAKAKARMKMEQRNGLSKVKK